MGENYLMTSNRVGKLLFDMGEPGVRARQKARAGAWKALRPYNPTLTYLVRPSLDEWLPE